jgi:hypothetical protein
MDTIAIIGALEQIAVSTLKIPGFQFGQSLAAAQRVFAEDAAPAKPELAEAVSAR